MKRSGSALILVLWCVLVLSIAILGAGTLVEQGLSSQRLAGRRFDARQIALTGIALGRDGKIEKYDPLLRQDMGQKKKLHVEIRSEGGRLNINRWLEREDEGMLAALFESWGVDEGDAAIAVDCLRDWVDTGELRSLHGAERHDLAGTPYALPENRPFLSVLEMADVKGMDRVADVKSDWREAFSVLSGDQLDLQEISEDLLVHFGKLTREQARQFIDYRDGPDRLSGTEDDVEITSTEQLAAIVGLTAAQIEVVTANFQVGKSPVRITSTGTVGETQYQIVAIVAAREKGVPLLWWEEK